MSSRVEEIQAAFVRVKSSAERVIQGDRGAKDQAFQDIFSLNNEIGRLARELPRSMGRMKEIQAYVNMITVGIKYDKEADLRQGLSVTEESVNALKKEFPDSP